MPTVNAATTLDWEFYPASYRARLRQYYSALKVWKPAVDSYDDLEKIQRGLATKQLQHAQITPEEKEAKIKAVDLYISNMRSYREAMRLYKTWLLQHHDINKSSYAWSDFVLAEWKDSQLGFRLPEKPPRIDRTDLEERQWNAHLKARQQPYFSVFLAWQSAWDSYDDLRKLQSGLATKQLQRAQITPQEKETRIKAIDLYISNMRSYRDAMRLWKTWLLKRHEINKSSNGWSAFVRAEWKDGQLDFHEPEQPPNAGRTKLEEKLLDARLKALDVKRASCIRQHCQILHDGACHETTTVNWNEGQNEFFYYLPAPFAP
ncbi:MAG: hypothetical protein M1826_003062 [Phylliscum demangeonii]|nr:MAG: hypothetical protein M1826_003062 [Phylliscum demangeonii]